MQKSRPVDPAHLSLEGDKGLMEQQRSREPRDGAVNRTKGNPQAGAAHSQKHKRNLDIASEFRARLEGSLEEVLQQLCN